MPKIKVICSWCGENVFRHPLHPVTRKPIVNFFCDNVCKGRWQVKVREEKGFTKEWLISEYIVKGKGAYQIGREIGRDGKRVWEWIKSYGIETRPRGHNHDRNLVKDGTTFLGRKHKKSSIEKIKKSWEGRDLSNYANNGSHMSSLPKERIPGWKGGISPERQSIYASKEWRTSVKAVWKRDAAKCRRCGKIHNTSVNRGTFHIHHVYPFKSGEKRCDVGNLVLLCRQCHYWVHSKKNVNNEFIETGDKNVEICKEKNGY